MSFVFAHRQDLLGGRLIPIVNAMRIAEAGGAAFRMTWRRGDDSFFSLVSDIEQIFTGPFTRLESEGGYIVDIDDPRILAASREVRRISTPEGRAALCHEFLVVSERLTDIVIDRRLAHYALTDDEPVPQVRKALSRQFSLIPKHETIETAFAAIEAALPSGESTISFHARKLHITQREGLQINRLDSHIPDAALFAIIESSPAKRILGSSDSRKFTRDLKAAFPDRAVSLDDILDTSGLSQIQRALVEMFYLSRASEVIGPLSAYGVMASIIGDAPFTNVLLKVAPDATSGSRYYQSHTQPPCLLHSNSPQEAALLLYESTREPDAAVALTLACRAFALRVCGFGHLSIFGDIKKFHRFLRRAAERAENPEVLAICDWIEDLLHGRTEGIQPLEISSGSPLDLLGLASRVLFAERITYPADPSVYLTLIEEAERLNINSCGLWLRKHQLHVSRSERSEARTAAEAAITANPGYGDAHHHLSILMLDVDPPRALASAIAATELDGDEAYFWYHRGLCEQANGLSGDSSFLTAQLIQPYNPAFATPAHPG